MDPGSLPSHPSQALLHPNDARLSRWSGVVPGGRGWGGAQPRTSHGNEGIPVSLLHHQETVLEAP